jgi:hypothetical protein
MAKYTIDGTSKLDDLIDSHMSRIIQAVLDKVPKEEIKALILGGGYGRGEGGILLDNGEEKLYNDYDLFVITPNLNRIKLKKIDRELKLVHKELTNQFGIDVDFGPCKPISYLSKAPFWLVFYELKYGHKVIFGEQKILNYLPTWDGADISLFEAIKLLLNRGVALIQSRLRLLDNFDEKAIEYVTRNNQKAVMAMGDALLMSEGLYHHSYLKRLDLIERLQSSEKYKLIDDVTLLTRYRQALEFKFRPTHPLHSRDELWSWTNEIIQLYEKVYFLIFQIYGNLEGKISKSEYNDYIKERFGFDKNLILITKNVLLNIKSNLFFTERFKEQIRHPRVHLFKVLPELLFKGSMNSIQEFEEGNCLTWKNNVDSFLNVWSMYN